jgi:hypothetical protein
MWGRLQRSFLRRQQALRCSVPNAGLWDAHELAVPKKCSSARQVTTVSRHSACSLGQRALSCSDYAGRSCLVFAEGNLRRTASPAPLIAHIGAAKCQLWVIRVGMAEPRRLPVYPGYCCKSRKSNDPKNLAKVDLWTSQLLRRFSTPPRRSVIDFG